MSVFVAGAGVPQSSINYINYIESNGTQYINTGFKPNNNSQVIIDCQMLSISGSSFYFGARTSAFKTNFNVLNVSGSIRSDYGESKISSQGENPLDRLLINKNKEICNINGIIIENSKSNFQCDYHLFLFACNTGGTPDYYSNLRIYSCKIYDNNILIRDYYPCIDENGVACLYDKVNKEYVYNSGTGEFVGG